MSEDKYQLYLGKYVVDPLEREPKLPSDLRVKRKPRGAAYYAVQFAKPLTRAERTRVQTQYRLRLTEYTPNLAFLEKLDPEQLEAVSDDPLFRASILYQPAFKLSPMIGKLSFRTEERKAVKGLLLRAVLFPDADPAAVAEAIKGSGGSKIVVQDDREIGGVAQVQFGLPSPDSLPRVARLEDVRWIEEVGEIVDDNVNAAGTIQSGSAGTETVWDQGIHGEGQIIAILDGGPLNINHCFFEDPVNNTPGPAHRKVAAIHNASALPPGGHATFVAGCAAGDDHNNPGAANRRGGAWASRLVSSNRHDPTTLFAKLTAAAASGATIHSNSWHEVTAGTGNPARYSQNAADVDSFTWNGEDHLVLGSAGNVGEEQGPPGTAKNAICVGASQADPNEMNFGDGNAGPTADGRRKPDLMAVGCGIESADVDTACGTRQRAACATSYATPHAAAAAALVRQYYSEGWYPTGVIRPGTAFVPSGALIKATLLNSTIDMSGVVGYPSAHEGWGLVRLSNVLFFPGSARKLHVWDVRNADGLATGESRTHSVDVGGNTQPLRVTLVWTEPPGAAGSANPVINDLDLVVTSPSGAQVYIGNDFVGGVSAPNSGAAPDHTNNVEMVLVNNPAPGLWTITVSGTAVNVGNPGQGYALVVTAQPRTWPCRPGLPDVPYCLFGVPEVPHCIPGQPDMPHCLQGQPDIPYCFFGLPDVPYCRPGQPDVPYCLIGQPSAVHCQWAQPDMAVCRLGQPVSQVVQCGSGLPNVVLCGRGPDLCAAGPPLRFRDVIRDYPRDLVLIDLDKVPRHMRKALESMIERIKREQ
jgi:hypothetical protein